MPTVWKFNDIKTGAGLTATNMEAVWEAHWDPISDNYTPDISAQGLLSEWAEKVRAEHPDGLVPISWFVNVYSGTAKTFEGMPFQFHPFLRDESFLSFFTWPTDQETGALLNWLTLPIVDKLWQRGKVNKGGFIQEATGWKPSILQPHVYLPSLEKGVRS